MAQSCVFETKKRAVLLLFSCTMFFSIDRAWSRIRSPVVGTPFYPSHDRFFDIDGSNVGSTFPQEEELYNFNEQIPIRGPGSHFPNGQGGPWGPAREQHGPGGPWGAPGERNGGLRGRGGSKRGRNGGAAKANPWGMNPSGGRYESMQSHRGAPGRFAGPEESLPFQLDNGVVSINDYNQDRGRRGIGVYPGESMYDPESMALGDPWDAPRISHRNVYPPPVDYYQDIPGAGMFFDDPYSSSRGRRSYGAMPMSPYDNFKGDPYDNQPDPYAPFYNERSYQHPPFDYQAPYSHAQQLSEFPEFPGSAHKPNSYSQRRPPTHSVSYGPYGYMDSDFDESILKDLERPGLEEQQQISGNPDFYRLDGNSRPDNFFGEMNNPEISGPPFGGNAQGRGKGKNGEGPNFDSAAALEEEVVMGDLRRGQGRTPPGYSSTNPRVQSRAPGARTPPPGYPDSLQHGPRPTRLQGLRNQKPIIKPHPVSRPRHGASSGRTHGPYPPPPPRNRNAQLRPPLSSMPRQVAARRQYLGNINDEFGPQSMNEQGGSGPYGRPGRRDDMYGRMNGINRQRRSLLADSFYDAVDDDIPQLQQRYDYQTPPLYTYEYPSLVYDPETGSPEVLLNRKQDSPRRLVRRLVKRPPLLRRENRLRRMRQRIPIGDDENENPENESEEIANELEPVTLQSSTILDDDSTTTPLTSDDTEIDDTTTTDTPTPSPTETEENEIVTEETETEITEESTIS